MSIANGTWDEAPPSHLSFFGGSAHPAKRDNKEWPEPKQPQAERADEKKTLTARFHDMVWGKPATLPERVDDEPRRLLSALTKLLVARDYDDYTLRPTPRAYRSARKMAVKAHKRIEGGLPLPRVAPDGNGGIIMEWRNARGVVKLGFAETGDDADNYIFYMSGELYRTIEATAENLVERLEWLNHE